MYHPEFTAGDVVVVSNPNLKSHNQSGVVVHAYAFGGRVEVCLDNGVYITIKATNLLKVNLTSKSNNVGISDRVMVSNEKLVTHSLVGEVIDFYNGMYVVNLDTTIPRWNGYIHIKGENLVKVTNQQDQSPKTHLTLGQLQPKLEYLFVVNGIDDLLGVDHSELARYTIHSLRNLLEHHSN